MGERTIPPFSLRLTFEERAKLERDAAGMALGAYIRSRLLDPETVAPRKRGKFPVVVFLCWAEKIHLGMKRGRGMLCSRFDELPPSSLLNTLCHLVAVEHAPRLRGGSSSWSHRDLHGVELASDAGE